MFDVVCVFGVVYMYVFGVVCVCVRVFGVVYVCPWCGVYAFVFGVVFVLV